MKRFRLALLLFPVLLGALAWGLNQHLKWRVENPTPTKADLNLRALMSKSSKLEVSIGRLNPVVIPQKESKKFIDSFFVATSQSRMNGTAIIAGNKVLLSFYLVKANKKTSEIASANFHSSYKRGVLNVTSTKKPSYYMLHPVTIKRWHKLLPNHPRIGPELRRRMKP